jgi:hypothetical protein
LIGLAPNEKALPWLLKNLNKTDTASVSFYESMIGFGEKRPAANL